MKAIRKILVPIDFSPNAGEATEWATELARRYDASLTILHVVQPVSYAVPEGYIAPSPTVLAEMMTDLGQSLEAAKKKIEASAPGVPVITELIQGVPFAEIVQFAREGDFDLMVMGTHGRTGLKHALLGSVAEKVARKAPCAVLTVRMREHRFEHP